MKKMAIVGFGCAGYNAVRTMRQKGYDGEIHVFTNTNLPPSNPMLTTYYVDKKISFKEMFPFGNMEQITSLYNLIIHTDTTIVSMDSSNLELTCDRGEKFSFDQILISTGADAFIPPFEGADSRNVFSIRTTDDAIAVKKVLDSGKIKSAVVVGASMVGIKIIELLNKRNINCTLADMAPHIFPLSALNDVALEIQDRLEKKGVNLNFSSGITSIKETHEGLTAYFNDNSKIPCDAVFLCIGTRANTKIADEKILINKGIVVDSYMRTTAPNVYSAGDCCEGNNLLTGNTQAIGVWANAARQGEVAGSNMVGASTKYYGTIPCNITHFMGMDFIGIGDNRSDGKVLSFYGKDNTSWLVVIIKDNKIECINILDNSKISGVLKNHLIKRLEGKKTPLSLASKTRLLNEGMTTKIIEILDNYRIYDIIEES